MHTLRAATLSIIATGVYAPSSVAEKWVDFARLDDGLSKLDTDSITYSNGTVRMWMKFLPAKAREIPPPPYAVTKKRGATVYDYSISLYYYNCTERTVAVVRSDYFDKDGQLLAQKVETRETATFLDIPPSSPGEKILQLCP